MTHAGPVQGVGRACAANKAGAHEITNGGLQKEPGGVCHKAQVHRNLLYVTDGVPRKCLQPAWFTYILLLHPPQSQTCTLCSRNDIRQDPVFRAQFHTMCANVGVDPLASNKGMWVQLLGFGDFYYELGVQIVEACLATRAYNGGFMELESLRIAVQVKCISLCGICMPGFLHVT